MSWRRKLGQPLHKWLARAVRDEQMHSRLARIETALESKGRDSVASKLSQLTLGSQYREMPRSTKRTLPLDETEFRAFSQNGEDGILWYIFSMIGSTNKMSVEICAGDGQQCNTANLIVNHGWTGLLVDGNEGNVARGQAFYREHPDTFTYPPRFLHAWIEAETVNELVAAQGFSGEIDLLSLDIDGIDYWLWKALTVVRPRVVVAEIQAIWGDTRAVTVPYRRDFRAEYVDGFGVYSGASLPAFVKLARAKGYRLIGTQRYGYNAFFLRDDVGQDLFPEASATDCLRHPFVRWAHENLLPKVADKEWLEV